MEQTPEHRPHLEDPIPVSDALDAMMYELSGSGVEMRSAMDALLDRQTELYEAHRQKRVNGEVLTPEEDQELEEITKTMLSLKELYEKYGPKDQ